MISFHDLVPETVPFESTVMSSNCVSRTKAHSFLLFRLQRLGSLSSGIWPDRRARRKLGSLPRSLRSLLTCLARLQIQQVWPFFRDPHPSLRVCSYPSWTLSPASFHFLSLHSPSPRARWNSLWSVGGDEDGRRSKAKDEGCRQLPASRRRSSCLLFFFSCSLTHKLTPVLILDVALQMKRKQKIVSQCRLQRDHSGGLDLAENLERHQCFIYLFLFLHFASY